MLGCINERMGTPDEGIELERAPDNLIAVAIRAYAVTSQCLVRLVLRAP
jgi:hypothetical protein